MLIKRLAGGAFQHSLSPRAQIPNTNPTIKKDSPRGNEQVEPPRASSGDGLAAQPPATGAVDKSASGANDGNHQGESAVLVPDPSGAGTTLPPDGSIMNDSGFGGGSEAPPGDGAVDRELGEEDADEELEERRQQAIERRRAVEEQNTEMYSEWRRRRLQLVERYRSEVDKEYGNHFAEHVMVEWATSQGAVAAHAPSCNDTFCLMPTLRPFRLHSSSAEVSLPLCIP